MNITASPELFVDANRVAEWLGIKPRRVLEMARRGQIPAHPLGAGRRKIWRFRLSEVDAAIVSKK
jgi:excisionase family DNA binding protein